MSTDIDISVTVNGVAYKAHYMSVKSTFLGYEDHGILSFNLDCESDSGYGVGVGGIALDGAPTKDGGSRTPSPQGMALISELIRVVGVESWEAIRGKGLLVLFEGSSGWCGRCVGIANPMTGKTLVFSTFLEGFQE